MLTMLKTFKGRYVSLAFYYMAMRCYKCVCVGSTMILRVACERHSHEINLIRRPCTTKYCAQQNPSAPSAIFAEELYPSSSLFPTAQNVKHILKTQADGSSVVPKTARRSSAMACGATFFNAATLRTTAGVVLPWG